MILSLSFNIFCTNHCGWIKPTLAVVMVLMSSGHISYEIVYETKLMWRHFYLYVWWYIQGIKGIITGHGWNAVWC